MITVFSRHLLAFASQLKTFLDRQLPTLLAVIGLFSFFNLFLLMVSLQKGQFQNGKQRRQARLGDFAFLRLYDKLFSRFLSSDKVYLKKELALIVELYTFNYKEYWNTFFLDRSLFILSGIVIALGRQSNNQLPFVLFPLVLTFFYMDISSGVTVKLLANMSLISDYHTIQLYNASNKRLSSLFSKKVQFFRYIRLPSLVAYLLFSLACFFYLKMPPSLLALLVLSIFAFWLLLPKAMLTNNLIYTRSNYEQFKQYIEDSTMVLSQVKDFYLLEIFYRLLILYVLAMSVLPSILNQEGLVTVFSGLLLAMFLFLALLAFLMDKIHKNICSSLEMGDFSLDITRIFKSSP